MGSCSQHVNVKESESARKQKKNSRTFLDALHDLCTKKVYADFGPTGYGVYISCDMYFDLGSALAKGLLSSDLGAKMADFQNNLKAFGFVDAPKKKGVFVGCQPGDLLYMHSQFRKDMVMAAPIVVNSSSSYMDRSLKFKLLEEVGAVRKELGISLGESKGLLGKVASDMTKLQEKYARDVTKLQEKYAADMNVLFGKIGLLDERLGGLEESLMDGDSN